MGRCTSCEEGLKIDNFLLLLYTSIYIRKDESLHVLCTSSTSTSTSTKFGSHFHLVTYSFSYQKKVRKLHDYFASINVLEHRLK